MKKLLFLFGLMLVLFTACTKDEDMSDIPPCVTERMIHFKEGMTCNGASVKEYVFQNQFVYVFDAACGNDMTATVIDEHCNVLGELGGLSGNMTINGVNFEANASYTQTLWSK